MYKYKYIYIAYCLLPTASSASLLATCTCLGTGHLIGLILQVQRIPTIPASTVGQHFTNSVSK